MADKIYSMQPMGARGRARDLQPPSLIDCKICCRKNLQYADYGRQGGGLEGPTAPLAVGIM